MPINEAKTEKIYQKHTRDRHWAERSLRREKLKDVTVETIYKPKHTVYKFTYKLA